MITATYTGPDEFLKGKTAAVQATKNDTVILAQFDDMALERNGTKYGFGWHSFDARNFDVGRPSTWPSELL